VKRGGSSSFKELIVRSHKRCEALKINKEQNVSKNILEGEELQKKLSRRRKLIISSEPFINQLYNFVKGSNFFAILTDEEGCILSVVGDEDILTEAFSLKMIPGAYMDEKNIGTNAMSIAISEKVPVQISGEEHYVKAYHRWTCSASPIRDYDGNIIGCLDLTGYSEEVHPHTLGMVVAAVDSIERMLKMDKCSQELMISRKYTHTIMDSIPIGIITSDLEGNIKVANTHASEMFGYYIREMKRMKIGQLFDGWEAVRDVLCSKKPFTDEEVFVNARKNKLQFNLSAYPILDNNENIIDVVYVFSEVKKVRKLANKIMGRQAIYTFDKIIGNNDKFIATIELSKKIADSKSTILISGESGTGKEIFAQSIHNYSNRKEEPFIAINCGAIPKNLIESELFGYEEGAFTGAKRSGHPGKFEVADGGTIFLDEIGEMPLDMQTRLLRVIEESTVSRIGGTNEILVDVRIIAATNKNLIEEVEKGNFRKDLFYRLNVLPIKLPPLRERKEDIKLLVEYFMKRIAKRLNKKMVKISDEQMEHLMRYSWPGNVRELENFIELIINTEEIPEHFKCNDNTLETSECIEIEQRDLSLDNMEKKYIIKALKKYNGNITLSAKALSIGRNTLYRKIKKHNIDCSEFEQRSIIEQ